MDTEDTELLRLILQGVNSLAETQKPQSRMIARILEILTAEADGPSPIAEMLRVIVASNKAQQEALERFEMYFQLMITKLQRIEIATAGH
jgi:hypothetical protein